MPYKIFVISDEHQVTVYKRKAARNLRLTIDPKGMIKVSIPAWAPYKAGLEFAKSKQSWISANHHTMPMLKQDQAIGKAHHLAFVEDLSKLTPASRITDNKIIISYPYGFSISDIKVQQIAQKASIRALRRQAESLLPQRLDILANKYGFSYRNLSIKNLKGRWGSCDQNKDIVLSLYLMQMPWQLIDYVIMHELTHTEVLRHGPTFWKAMEQFLPESKQLRRSIRAYQPVVSGTF
jgi:predicted metal-dependent hydrolase